MLVFVTIGPLTDLAVAFLWTVLLCKLAAALGAIVGSDQHVAWVSANAGRGFIVANKRSSRKEKNGQS